MSDRDAIMRVALVRGPIVAARGALNNEATPAIALAYLAGYIRKKGYDPVIIDAVAEGIDQVWPLANYAGFNCLGLTFEEIIEMIPVDCPVIGFSGMFSSEWPVIRDLITETRRVFPNALMVAGGEHVTALTEYSLRDCPALDICVRGEGEQTFLSLLETWCETGTYDRVEGIGYLDSNGDYRQNSGLPRIREIDEIPWPYWPNGYLEKFWEAGKSFGVGTERDMPFLVSRGCPYRCTFCSSENMWTTRYILRDIEDVVAELKHYVEHYRITSVQLYDLTAIIKKKWIIELADRLEEEDIRVGWSVPSGTRSEALDKETLTAMRKMGCRYLVYAPESGDPATLKRIKKQVDLKKLTNSVIEAHRQGYTIRVNLIIGFPVESRMEIFRTVWYGLKMSARGVDEVPLYIYSPYPGTAIFEQLVAEKGLNVDDKYFFNLSTLNSAYLSFNVISFNPNISPRILGMIRLLALLANYGIAYLFYPKRIVRTLRNVLGGGYQSNTVFEHRLKDLIQRKKIVRMGISNVYQTKKV